MNETLNVLKTRRSIRSYKPDMITEEELDQVLEAGTYAPTAMGKQNPIIIAIKDKETRDQLEKMNATIIGNHNGKPFYGAPVVILVASKKNTLSDCDGSCVIDNMLNAAWSLGLGSCWIHRAKEELEMEEGKEILRKAGVENPEEYVGIGHVILGYINGEAPAPRPRKEHYIYKI